VTTPEVADALTFGPFDIDASLPAPATTTLLEASAGTGKTWAIAALVARYVIEDGTPLDKLLVVTFGRAASQELRSRVRERLVEAERLLESAVSAGNPDPGEDALSARLLRADADELLRRRNRARRALTDFDAATIATIHQFCHLVLRGLGAAGDTDARAELVEDLEELREQVVDDLYAAWFASSPEEPVLSRAEAGELARRVVGDPQALLRPEDGGTDAVADVRVRFACAVREQMQVRKRRLGILSYDDLLSRLADVLEHEGSPAQLRMRERWDVVLVDEFQDTDPVQWEVFRRAFGGHAAMVLIGDPKQAIYAFRGGDVVTYTRARGSADVLATLDVNYRSDGPLVSAVTAVLRGARLGDGIEVREVRAQQQAGRLAGAPSDSSFRLRLVHRSQFGHPSKPPAIAVAREAVAADMARDVAALLAARPVYDGVPLRAEDVAVLCSTAAQCEIAHRALAEVDVPSVVLGAASVFASVAATDWLTLLEALEQPHRSSRVRAAALTCFLGRTAREVADGGDELTHEVAELARDWARLLRQRGVAAVLEVAGGHRDSAGRAMGERLLARQDGERLLTDVRHVGELLHDLASRDGLQLPALLTWLRAQIAETRRDAPEDRARRLDSDAKAVQVLTVHKSKGLQYPVVYLPFASDFSRRTDPMPLFHDDAGRRCLDVSAEPDAQHRRRADAELSDEALRLLYVAMTRARSQLVTWWFASQRNVEASALHRVLMGRLPDQAEVPATAPAVTDEEARARAEQWQAVGGPTVELVRPRSQALDPEPATPEPVEVRRWSRSVDDGWRRTSYTALAHAAEAHATEPAFGSEAEVTPKEDEPDVPLPEEEPGQLPGLPSPMAQLPTGATFGSLVHAVLEHADPAAPDHGGDFRAALHHHITEQRVRWPVELDTDELVDALVQVCDTPLGPAADDVTLREVGLRDRLAELDFELPLVGGDRWSAGGTEVTLADLAPVLRAHLPDGDPLLGYADTLSGEGYAGQQLRGYLAGSVDVVLRVGERYLVVDYKTNYLGPWTEPPTPLTTAHYTPERLAGAMSHSSYPLQALLYAVVLHRFLRWRLPGYHPGTHFGGVLYLYLRGMAGADTPRVDGHPCGVFSWQPPVALVEAVSDLLDGRLDPGVTARRSA
jgi:exodeoxyribonuclease V beta subunit